MATTLEPMILSRDLSRGSPYAAAARRRLDVIDDVLSAVSEAFQVTTQEMRSRKGTLICVRARHAAMWFMYKTGLMMTYADIGAQFGNRDHTSVLYAVRRIDAILRATDDSTGWVRAGMLDAARALDCTIEGLDNQA